MAGTGEQARCHARIDEIARDIGAVRERRSRRAVSGARTAGARCARFSSGFLGGLGWPGSCDSIGQSSTKRGTHVDPLCEPRHRTRGRRHLRGHARPAGAAADARRRPSTAATAKPAPAAQARRGRSQRRIPAGRAPTPRRARDASSSTSRRSRAGPTRSSWSPSRRRQYQAKGAAATAKPALGTIKLEADTERLARCSGW